MARLPHAGGTGDRSPHARGRSPRRRGMGRWRRPRARRRPRLVGEDGRPGAARGASPDRAPTSSGAIPASACRATRRVFHALLPDDPRAEGHRHRGLPRVRRAPSRARRAGAGPGELLLPAATGVLARPPYHAFHRFGVERRRADVIRRAASRAAWLEAAASAAEADARLRSLPGIGPWTAAEVLRSAFGDPDALSVGDYHSRTSWRGRWPASRAAMTRACSSCSSPTAVSAAASSASWRSAGSCARATARGWRHGSIAAHLDRADARSRSPPSAPPATSRPFALLARALVARGHEVTAMSWPVHRAALVISRRACRGRRPACRPRANRDRGGRCRQPRTDGPGRGPARLPPGRRRGPLPPAARAAARTRPGGPPHYSLAGTRRCPRRDLRWVTAIVRPGPAADGQRTTAGDAGPRAAEPAGVGDARPDAGPDLAARSTSSSTRPGAGSAVPLFRARSPLLHLVACSPSIIARPPDCPPPRASPAPGSTRRRQIRCRARSPPSPMADGRRSPSPSGRWPARRTRRSPQRRSA